MRYTILIILCFLSVPAMADPVKTFSNLCFANLGNPTAIIRAGKRAGFRMTSLGSPSSSMGMRNRTDESLQVNVFTQHAFECAVTTSDVDNPSALAKEFFDRLGLRGRKRGKIWTAAGRVSGKKYVFVLDTNSGEALVVYSD